MVKAFASCRIKKRQRPIFGALSLFETDGFEFPAIRATTPDPFSEPRQKQDLSNKRLLFSPFFELLMKIAVALFTWAAAISAFLLFSAQTTQDHPFITEWDYPTT